MSSTTEAQTAEPWSPHGLAATVAQWIERVRVARDRSAARAQLRRLSPRLLADIGVEPHQIAEVVDGLVAARAAARAADRGEIRARTVPAEGCPAT